MSQRDLFDPNEPMDNLLDDLVDEIDGKAWYTVREATRFLPFKASKILRLCHDGSLAAQDFGTEKKANFKIIGNELKRYLYHGPRTIAE
ncbi:hypothetical protein KQI63_05860 [bacterium]|nr:hypothetical protein [bacterium]